VSPTCCRTCNGTVVSDGTVIGTEILDDDCGTVRISACKCKIRNRQSKNGILNYQTSCEYLILGYFRNRIDLSEAMLSERGDGDAAVAKPVAKDNVIIAAAIEEEYRYEKCCADKTGINYDR
jgi:hypothetical protein